jgi:hypothetical protein
LLHNESFADILISKIKAQEELSPSTVIANEPVAVAGGGVERDVKGGPR